ncbi:DUF6059 family protein [Streptomyces sp. NPDC054940]
MKRFARGALRSLRGQLTVMGTAKRIVIRHGVLPVWRALVAFGSMYVGMVERNPSAQPPHDGYVLYGRPQACPPWPPVPASEAGEGVVPGFVEPPAGHPERLRPDLPLTEVERALARQLSGPSAGGDPTVS